MPYTLAQAKIEVARSIGGHNDADELLAAGIAINKAIRFWNREHTWEFLKFDNLSDQLIPSKLVGTTAVTLPTGVTFPNFGSVYVGTTVSGVGIPDGTTVVTKNSNTSLVLSAATTVPGDPVTLTYGGGIPIVAGVRDYELPFSMLKPSWARLSAANRALMYARTRIVNHVSDPDSSWDGVYGYTFISIPGVTSSVGIAPLPTTKIRLFGMPGEGDILYMEGWRGIQLFLNDLTAGDEARPLDVPEEFQDDLLELATYFYQNNKDSENSRTGDKKQNASYFLRRAIRRDLGMDDEEVRFLAPDEFMAPSVRMRRDSWGW